MLFYLRSYCFAKNNRYKASLEIMPFGRLSHNLTEKVTL